MQVKTLSVSEQNVSIYEEVMATVGDRNFSKAVFIALESALEAGLLDNLKKDGGEGVNEP